MQSKLQTGLTMIELLIVLAIAATLVAVATPSLSSLIRNMRQASTMTQLTNDLNRARIEAIKRNLRVLVCSRSSDTTCGTGTSWNNGWLVCYDGNGDGTCDLGTISVDPNPIVVHPPINTNLTLTGSAASIRFNPRGTQGGTGSDEIITLAGSWVGAVSSVARITATGNISKTN